MKLDRNTNPDGKGKYALINLRRNTVEWGDTPDNQFFVLKYRDRFAGAALLAYAKAIRDYVKKLRRVPGQSRLTAELCEYESEIRKEARKAKRQGELWKKIPD